ncbi:MAG: M48 family metalloprotease [Polyangiaceae bacterium]|nr:M48 family metalloprotease [Polyangiaceae bacterium]
MSATGPIQERTQVKAGPAAPGLVTKIHGKGRWRPFIGTLGILALMLPPLGCAERQIIYPAPGSGAYGGAMGFGAQPSTGAKFASAFNAVPSEAGDPINNIDIPWLRGRTQDDYEELTGALPDDQRARINGIPLLVDDEPGVVNAFAACTSGGAGVIAVSDGLLDVTAHLAQCKATDERFGTRKVDEYIDFMAKNQVWGEPLVHPPESFWNPAQKNDPQKIKRQHEIFDEEVGFVVGHEMGHHYLGHLPCTAGNVTAAEANVVIRSAAPGFNQINEVGADSAATRNVLVTGDQRSSLRSEYKWTENGAVLFLGFFAGLRQLRPTDLVFAFESTHPPAQVRIPIVQQGASAYRMTGGAPLPIPLPF